MAHADGAMGVVEQQRAIDDRANGSVNGPVNSNGTQSMPTAAASGGSSMEAGLQPRQHTQDAAAAEEEELAVLLKRIRLTRKQRKQTFIIIAL